MRRTFKTTGTDRGKRLNDLPDGTDPKRRKTLAADQSAVALSNSLSQQSPDNVTQGATEDPPAKQHGIQFLDLHTNNPIVSYKGEAFTCTWTDLIGTSMFFSQAKETPLYDPEISTNDYDMVGMSRIRLVGNPIKVTPLSQNAVLTSSAKPAYQDQPVNIPEKPGKSLGSIRRSSAKVNADLRKQANFLEQLMNVKRNRGDNDNVHVIMNSKILKTAAAGKLKFTTQRREDEIDQLNRRIVRGDGEALRKLEQIYSGQNEDSDDDASAGEELAEGTRQSRDPRSRTANSTGESQIPDTAPDTISTPDVPIELPTNSDILNTNDNAG